MNLDQLEQFVMDTIDVIFTNPGEYEAKACKSTVAYRFELHRLSLNNKISTHLLPRELFNIECPQIHRLTQAQIEEYATDSATERPT